MELTRLEVPSWEEGKSVGLIRGDGPMLAHLDGLRWPTRMKKHGGVRGWSIEQLDWLPVPEDVGIEDRFWFTTSGLRRFKTSQFYRDALRFWSVSLQVRTWDVPDAPFFHDQYGQVVDVVYRDAFQVALRIRRQDPIQVNLDNIPF